MVREKKIKKVLFFCMPMLLLLSPYVYFIQFNVYGFNHYESIMLCLLIIIVGFTSGALLVTHSWILRTVIFILLVSITLSFFPLFQNGWVLKATFIIIVLLAIFCLEKTVPIICVMSAVFIATCILMPMKQQFVQPIDTNYKVSIDKKLPTVVHIILDEHIGINAIPQNISHGDSLKKQLIQFYLSNGFTLYSNAYSHYSRTYNSIPNLLNFLPKAQNATYFADGLKHLDLYKNSAFTLLSEKGYAINIFQPQYINFCKAKNIRLEQCYTYPVHSLEYAKNLSISRNQHLIYLSKSFLLLSSIYRSLMIGYEYYLRPSLLHLSINLPHWSWHQDQVSAAAVPETLNALANAIIAHPKGRVYFAHILLPHSPYIFNQYCQPNPKVNQWMMNYDLGPYSNTDKQRAVHYRYYEGQLKCDYHLLNQFVNKLKKAGDFDNTIFIINGDHSSRIAQVAPFPDNATKFTQQDFEDSFATLYAVKFLHASPRIVADQVPITRLYAETITKLTQQKITEDLAENYIYLTVKRPKNKQKMPTLLLSQIPKK
ncbi:MAG: hypothetical protein CMF49_07410 [Legionellales bacterium]|nr:hypothetical protein [Legionellales bacterium]